MVTCYCFICNYVVALPVAFSKAHLNHIVISAEHQWGTSTDEGAVLEPHQVAVDCQELKRLHCLMGAMLGGSAPAAAGMTLDFLWRQPFQHNSGLGCQGGQHLGFLGGGLCTSWQPSSTSQRSWPKFLGEGGSKACGWTWGNGWKIFGGPVKGSTGLLWMASFRVSCRFSLVHCRT